MIKGFLLILRNKDFKRLEVQHFDHFYDALNDVLNNI